MSTQLNKLLIAVAVISLTSSTLAFAQPCNGKGPGPNQAANSNTIGYGLAKQLNLAEHQQKQVQMIIKQQRKEARTWRQQHQQATETKLSTVLSAEQMKNFKAWKQQRRHLKAKKFKRSM